MKMVVLVVEGAAHFESTYEELKHNIQDFLSGANLYFESTYEELKQN